MFEQVVDVTRLDGFVRYTRGIVRARLILVTALLGLLAIFTPLSMTVFGLVEFAIYAILYLATAAALRHPDADVAFRRLRWQSITLVCLLSINACALAIKIRLLGHPIMRVESALVATCVLLFAALRVHTGKVSYVTAVTPPVAALLWIALDRDVPLAANHYAWGMLVFVAAVLTATWRQQVTDRALARTLHDLARKNADLTQAIEEAKAASRAKSDLLAVASHEIRTPLNAVLGFAHALRRDTFLTPTQSELAQGVLDGGAQLTRLLDTVLDLTRVEAGKAVLAPVPVDLRRLVRTVVRVWSAHAQAVGVVLGFEDADPQLPYGVLADEAKLEQTLVNLVSNALKATPSGGMATVRLAGVLKDETLSVLVEVRDGGARVPPEDRPRMFEAFDQTERGRQLGGSGLGLSICAANLALMGGEIGIDDPPVPVPARNAPRNGAGAVFWFAFEAPVQTPPAVETQGVEPRVAGPVRVLAAEDNAANRRVLAALLASAPVELVFAEDGAQALDAWRVERFDLVLMDVNMPVLDGLAALGEIRRVESLTARPRTRVWMLTANVFDDDVTRYRGEGADGVLRKPIDTAALFALLAEAAEARAASSARPEPASGSR